MNEQLPLKIILVEDDPGHAQLIEKNLRRAGVANELVLFQDGGAAVDFLFKNAGAPSAAQQPVLVLLDINLPVLDGHQVLQRLKGDERTRRIPVVILTTTDNPSDISRSYRLGCNVYITKPVEYEQFSDAVRKLGMMLSIIKVPEAAAHHG